MCTWNHTYEYPYIFEHEYTQACIHHTHTRTNAHLSITTTLPRASWHHLVPRQTEYTMDFCLFSQNWAKMQSPPGKPITWHTFLSVEMGAFDSLLIKRSMLLHLCQNETFNTCDFYEVDSFLEGALRLLMFKQQIDKSLFPVNTAHCRRSAGCRKG